MTVRIKAHFDGKTIVPDEPVSFPAGTSLIVEATMPAGIAPAPTVEERLAAIRRIASRATQGPQIPDGAFRRENMYGDDGR
jgi:hypothetical protein